MVDSKVSVSLDAVILTVTDNRPKVLVVDGPEGRASVLPSGPLDPDLDDTLELAVRRWLRIQTGIEVAYVEQLYTFGDKKRSGGTATGRELAVVYVALVPEETPATGSLWIDTYDLFPWEDLRDGSSGARANDLSLRLERWVRDGPAREDRTRITFGIGLPWDPIRVLERYELLYEAGFVAERFTDQDEPVATEVYGTPLGGDHRRVVATALGRVRGKLTYRPVIFEVMTETFTLTELQHSVEALVGIELHQQNLRRIVERGELVEQTGEHRKSTGGRPAAFYRFRSDVVSERPHPGFPLPRPKLL